MTTVSIDQLPEITVTSTKINPADATNNPLKDYRSYSYHFILIAADTTAYLDVSSDNKTIQSLVTNKDFYKRENPLDPRAIKSDPNGLGRYCIFIDTRSDTDYIIDDVEWGTTFIGNSNSSDSGVGLNTFLTDGKMKIIEPRGVSFLNTLAALAGPDKLDTDPSTMPFMLKVIFMGHKDDGSVPEPIYDTPAFGIYLTDITGNIDANGTTYEIKYCGYANGAAWSKTYDSIPDGLSFKFKPGAFLIPHLEEFEKQINDKYIEDRNKFIQNYLTATGVDLSNTPIIKWKLVFNIAGSQAIQALNDFGTLTPQHYKTDGYSSQTPGTKEGGVAQLIDDLFSSSAVWQKWQISGTPNLKEFPDNTTRKFNYKISTKFDKSSSLQDNIFTVTYTIDEYEYTAIDIVNAQSGQGSAKPPVLPPEDVYTFDYIFTGKNIDIQKLDMNLSLGYALWISLVTSNSLSTQGASVNGTSPSASIVQTRPVQSNMDPRQALRKGSPIWPVMMTKPTPKTELQQPSTVAASDAIWRNFASIQAIQTDLTILGNPLLINSITIPNATSPNYVKINIKMPSTTDDIWEYNLNTNNTPDGYYKTFWFDGYYNIITAKNRFIGGQFTQELQLIGIPEVSSDMIATAATNEQGASTASAISTTVPKVPSQPGLNMTPLTNPSIHPTPPTSSSLSKTSQPTLSYNFISSYWNDAVNASNNYAAASGKPAIDPDFIMAQAAVESGWGTNSLTSYNNLTSIRATNGLSTYWDGAITPNQFRAYDTPLNGFTDNVRLVSTLYSPHGTGALSAPDIQTYAYYLQHPIQYQQGPLTSEQYQAAIVDAYAQIQSAKAHFGIVGRNLYGNPTTMVASQQNNFLPSISPPYQDIAPATPTTYSGPNRSITTAALQQTTPVKVGNAS